MIIVIPFGSPKDTPQLKLLAKVISKLSIVQQKVLLVHAPALSEEASEVANTLKEACASVELLNTEENFFHGWFKGPNRMFHWVVEHLEVSGSNDAFLWLEADCCPLVKGWSDTLENAYEASGQPYFGFVRPTLHKRPDGSHFTKPNDNMLMGGGTIYPPHMYKNPALIPLLRNLSIENEKAHAAYPWDVYCRWQFFKKGVHATTLTFDRWGTCNYRYQGGVLHCDAHADYPTANGGVIPPETVLVHGCKDESLHRLVLDALTPKPRIVAPPPAPVVELTPPPAPVVELTPPPAPVVELTPPPAPVVELTPPPPAPVVELTPPTFIDPWELPAELPAPKPAVAHVHAPAPILEKSLEEQPPRKRIGRPPGSKDKKKRKMPKRRKKAKPKGRKRRKGPKPKPKKRGPKPKKPRIAPLNLKNLVAPGDRLREAIRFFRAHKFPLGIRTIAATVKIGPLDVVRQELRKIGYAENSQGTIRYLSDLNAPVP